MGQASNAARRCSSSWCCAHFALVHQMIVFFFFFSLIADTWSNCESCTALRFSTPAWSSSRERLGLDVGGMLACPCARSVTIITSNKATVVQKVCCVSFWKSFTLWLKQEILKCILMTETSTQEMSEVWPFNLKSHGGGGWGVGCRQQSQD